MSDLLSQLNNSNQEDDNLLAGRPNRIAVLVEDEMDVVSWHKMLHSIAPDKEFLISPYSYDKCDSSKGKQNVLNEANRFGSAYIGCVDSDYDWLLEDYTDDGYIISHNNFILQTFGYSIENLVLQPEGMADRLIECTYNSSEEVHDFIKAYPGFLSKISHSIYEVLIWQLVLVKEHEKGEGLKNVWNFIFNNNNYSDLSNDTNRDIKQILNDLGERLDALAYAYSVKYTSKYPQFIESRKTLETELCQRYGLTKSNAYLFVRGHNIFDFMIFNVFDPIVRRIRLKHESEIRTGSHRNNVGNNINHYHNLIKNVSPAIQQNLDFMNSRDNFIRSLLMKEWAKMG